MRDNRFIVTEGELKRNRGRPAGAIPKNKTTFIRNSEAFVDQIEWIMSYRGIDSKSEAIAECVSRCYSKDRFGKDL